MTFVAGTPRRAKRTSEVTAPVDADTPWLHQLAVARTRTIVAKLSRRTIRRFSFSYLLLALIIEQS